MCTSAEKKVHKYNLIAEIRKVKRIEKEIALTNQKKTKNNCFYKETENNR